MPNGDPSGLGQATAAAPAACGNNDVGGGAAGCGAALAPPVDADREISGIGDEPPEPVLTPVGPVINVAKPYVLVHKDYLPDDKAVRVKVHLTTDAAFDGTGTLTITTPDDSSAGLAFYHSEHGDDFWFDSWTQDFPGDDLTIGIDLWAQGTLASSKLGDITLELSLAGGSKPIKPPVQGTLTAVEVTLDLCMSRATLGADPVPLSDADKINAGRFVHVQKAQHHGRALLIVRKAKPPDFPGTLVLLRDNAKVRVFNDEIPAAGQAPIALPQNLANGGIPADGQKYWVEGVSASAALIDTGFKLGVQGLTKQDGDWAKVTVVQFSALTADVSSTPPLTARLGNGPVNRHIYKEGSAAKHYDDDFTKHKPLVLIENSTDDIKLSVTMAPAAVPFAWTIERARKPGTADFLDHADIVNMSGAGAMPVVDPPDTPSATATLNTDTPGSFHIRAYVDCNGSGDFQGDDEATGQRIDREPFIVLNYVVARVQGFSNSSRANAAHAVFNPAAPTTATGVKVSTGGPGTAMWPPATKHLHACFNDALVTVTGGGPDGKLGLERVFAGWVNNELTVASSITVPQGEDVVCEYLDVGVAPNVTHRSISVWVAGGGNFMPGAAGPNSRSGPFLDTTPFGAEGTGGNRCVGTENMPGPRTPIQKTDLGPGQNWRVQMWDSPGDNCPPAHAGGLAGVLVRYRFNLDFRSDLCFWTNVNETRGASPGTTGAACRLYSTVITNHWSIRIRFRFNRVTGVGTNTANSITMVQDPDPKRFATPAEGDVETRGPISLNLLGLDLRN